jgi:Flp pilus assembly protein CpaB
VVGGFLIALSALGIYVAWSVAAGSPTTSYVVARHDVAVGTRLTAADLTTAPMELPPSLARTGAFARSTALVGATTVGPIRAGELVQAGDVVRTSSQPDALELAFAVEPARAVGGSLRPGERVDVLATFGSGATAYTVTVVRQAQVLDVGADGSGLGAGRSLVVRLAVATSDEALALAHAVNAGDVTLVRATGSDRSGPVGQSYTAPAAGDGSTGGH